MSSIASKQQQQQPIGDPPGVRTLVVNSAGFGTIGNRKQKSFVVVQQQQPSLRTSSSSMSNDAPALKRYEPSVLVPSDARSIHASNLPTLHQQSSASGTLYGGKNPYASRSSNNYGRTSIDRNTNSRAALTKALPRMQKDNTTSSTISTKISFQRSSDKSVISLVNPYINSDDNGEDDDEVYNHQRNSTDTSPTIIRPYSNGDSSSIKPGSPNNDSNVKNNHQDQSKKDDIDKEQVLNSLNHATSISLANHISSTTAKAVDEEEAFMNGEAIYSIVSEPLPFPVHDDSITGDDFETKNPVLPVAGANNHTDVVSVGTESTLRQQHNVESFVTTTSTTVYYSTIQTPATSILSNSEPLALPDGNNESEAQVIDDSSSGANKIIVEQVSESVLSTTNEGSRVSINGFRQQRDPSVATNSTGASSSRNDQFLEDSHVFSMNNLSDPSLASWNSASDTTSSDLLLPTVNRNKSLRDPSVASSSVLSSTSTLQTSENNCNRIQPRDPSVASNSSNPSLTVSSYDSALPKMWKTYMDPTLTIDEATPSLSQYNDYEDDEEIHASKNDAANDTTESSYSHVVDDDEPAFVVEAQARSVSTLPDSPSRNSTTSKDINLVRKSSPPGSTTTSNTLSKSDVDASDYFERSIIDEYNFLIETEQRDSSVMSIPMVPAVLDDATTIVPVSRDNRSGSAANVGQQQEPEMTSQPGKSRDRSIYETSVSTVGTDGAVYGQQFQNALNYQRKSSIPPKRLQKPPRQLPISQLTKLRQEYGLPVGYVMEIARYQKLACTFFVCDINNVEDRCILDCAKLSAAVQSQIVFCLGNSDDTKEVLFPPRLSDPRMNGAQRQKAIAAALHATVSTIRSPTWSKAAPLSRTTQKLLDLTSRIPTLEYWQSEKMAIVIATNRTFGYKGDAEFLSFVSVIKSFLKLNVQIVIRLSTVDDVVVTYYNNLKEVFPKITIVFTYEITKIMVQRYNPWFNYGEPFHRLQELGYTFHSVFDLLGQRKMSLDEIRTFFIEFYGKKAMMYSPDLYSEFDQFHRYVESINEREGKHRLGVHPKNKDQLDYWMDTRKLYKVYNNTKGGFLLRSLRLSKPRSNNRSRAIDPCIRVDI